MTLKMEVVKDKFYYVLDKHIWIAPHCIVRAEQRGVERSELISKLFDEREKIKDVVANKLGMGTNQVRGVFFLTFDSGKKGKVVWEIMSKKASRLETIEEIQETSDCVIVLYTYLSEKQPFYAETSTSYRRREREGKYRSL